MLETTAAVVQKRHLSVDFHAALLELGIVVCQITQLGVAPT
jgi:hypothetical protein